MEKKISTSNIRIGFGLLLVISPLFNSFKFIIALNFIQRLRQPLVIIIFILLSMVSLTSGIGILLLKEWSRRLVLLYAVFMLVDNLLRVFTIRGMGNYEFSNVLSGIIFGSAILFFFTRPKVKEQFKKEEIPNA